jgi:hypothetical protein
VPAAQEFYSGGRRRFTGQEALGCLRYKPGRSVYEENIFM